MKFPRTDERRLHAAPVLDLFSRRVIGLAMSASNDGALARSAIESAAATRSRSRTVRLHSDRGGIYGKREYVRRLEVLEIERSMSRASNPCDNAATESFFSTLHFELLSRKRFKTLENARAVITEWIENFYNTERRHTTIRNASPIKYELSWQMREKRT